MGETKRSRSRDYVILLLILSISVAFAAAASGSHGDTNPPPPPPRIRGMVEQYYVGHRARQEILRRLDAVESMMKEQMKSNEQMLKNNEQMRKVLQGQDKVLQGQDKSLDQSMQKLQQMRSYLSMQILQETRSDSRKRQDDYEPPRQEAACQAQAMDEGTGSTYKLRFHGSLKTRIYTNKPLLDQSDGRIEIAIYRDGQIITSGDLSSVSVEIVALESNHTCKGSWTEEDFHRQIQMRRSGQGSVLEGDLSVKLVDGKASLGNVRFIESSTGRHKREFVLAARIDMREKMEGLRVEEAFMQPPITVLVERSEANEKSGLPMLNDKVHRLKEIAKGGVYSQRLEQDGISTVQDFLKALNKDEDKLRQILKMKSDKSWKVLVGHARECDLRDKHELKRHMVAGENVPLFFNCIHDNVGAEFNDLYIAKDKFDRVQKALVDRLKKQAYNELDGIDFQYVMKDNRPEKISANVNAAGSSSIPMSGASPQNTPDHHAHAVSQGADCNAAGPSASEPSPPDHHYTHQNQGVAGNSISEGDAVRLGTAATDVDSDPFSPTMFESDPLDPPTSTSFGPYSELFTPEGQFRTFPPPEVPLQNSPRMSGGFFPSGDQFWTFSTAPSGGGGGN